MDTKPTQKRLVRLVVKAVVIGIAVVVVILACGLIGQMIFGPAL